MLCLSVCISPPKKKQRVVATELLFAIVSLPVSFPTYLHLLGCSPQPERSSICWSALCLIDETLRRDSRAAVARTPRGAALFTREHFCFCVFALNHGSLSSSPRQENAFVEDPIAQSSPAIISFLFVFFETGRWISTRTPLAGAELTVPLEPGPWQIARCLRLHLAHVRMKPGTVSAVRGAAGVGWGGVGGLSNANQMSSIFLGSCEMSHYHIDSGRKNTGGEMDKTFLFGCVISLIIMLFHKIM